MIDITPAYIPEVNPNYAEIETFVNAVTGVGKALCTAEEGIKVQQIIDAIYSSVGAG